MNWLRELNTLFNVLKQASVEFVKTWLSIPMKDLRKPTGGRGGLQKIKERHFQLLIDGEMAERYC